MTDSEPRASDELDRTVRVRLEAGDLGGAASLAIAHYGPEVYGYLRAMARDEDLASDAFAVASEQLWRHLPTFRWEASLRTWAYQLARHALHQLRTAPSRRPDRNLPLSIAPSVEAVARTRTAIYQRTEIKEGMRALREALPTEDQELLILRLERNMSWKDIARSIADLDDATDITARAAALRKRYERVKEQLRELAIARGLMPES